MDPWEVRFRKKYDFPPDDEYMFSEKYSYDLGNEFGLQYEEQEVVEVFVDRTDCYAFDVSGLDEEKAEAAEKDNMLPNGIHFKLTNGVDFGICADDSENFYIEVTSV